MTLLHWANARLHVTDKSLLFWCVTSDHWPVQGTFLLALPSRCTTKFVRYIVRYSAVFSSPSGVLLTAFLWLNNSLSSWKSMGLLCVGFRFCYANEWIKNQAKRAAVANREHRCIYTISFDCLMTMVSIVIYMLSGLLYDTDRTQSGCKWGKSVSLPVIGIIRGDAMEFLEHMLLGHHSIHSLVRCKRLTTAHINQCGNENTRYVLVDLPPFGFRHFFSFRFMRTQWKSANAKFVVERTEPICTDFHNGGFCAEQRATQPNVKTNKFPANNGNISNGTLYSNLSRKKRKTRTPRD